MLRLFGSLVFGMIFSVLCLPVFAQSRDWSGLNLRFGLAAGQGDFTLSHQSEHVSPGNLLQVPTEGFLTTAGAGYRWRLAKSHAYAGLKLDVYVGDLTGFQAGSHKEAYARLDFATSLTATLGGTIGYAFGREQQLLGYIGAGVAASQAHITALAGYQDQRAQKTWDGGAFGPYLELGGNYAFSRRGSIFIEVKKFFFQADERCIILDNDCGHFKAETKPLIATAGFEWTF